MKREIYPARKTFVRYDDEHFLLYLNEEVLNNFVPEDAPENDPGTYYAYSGSLDDGGTLIKSKEADYDSFVSGLIRTRFSADRVESILLNMQSDDPDRMPQFRQDLEELNVFRQECKDIAASLLS